MTFPAEPLLLGFGSGLACLGSCGSLLLPWMAAAPGNLGARARILARFLGGRLAGYLLFAFPAWAWGWALARNPGAAPWILASTDLALAAALAGSAAPLFLPGRPGRCGLPALRRRWRNGTPALLGLLTGLNLCPPFLAALLRAGAGLGLRHALGFFLLFFAGTTPWFLPFLGTGLLRRVPGLRQVARGVLLLLAAGYAYLGAAVLLERLCHGR